MLSAIRDIGELVVKRSWPIEERIDGKIFSIVLDNDKSSYDGINIENFDCGKINRYLFKRDKKKLSYHTII